MARKSKAHVEAAKRGLVTKKKNEAAKAALAKKRSEAAKKAAATRAANKAALAKKRSDAAKKAAATRKKNQLAKAKARINRNIELRKTRRRLERELKKVQRGNKAITDGYLQLYANMTEAGIPADRAASLINYIAPYNKMPAKSVVRRTAFYDWTALLYEEYDFDFFDWKLEHDTDFGES